MTDATEQPPHYICRSFNAAPANTDGKIEEWLNKQHRKGYRLTDGAMMGASGSSRRVHLIMERQDVAPTSEAEVA